jgi:hypothetical protein
MENEEPENFERDIEEVIRIINFIDERVRSKKLVLTPLQEVDLNRAKAVINRLQDQSDNVKLMGVIHLN